MAAASIFDDRERFSEFFRVLPSFSHLAEALASFAEEMGWSQVAVITQDVTIWSDVCDFSLYTYQTKLTNILDYLLRICACRLLNRQRVLLQQKGSI